MCCAERREIGGSPWPFALALNFMEEANAIPVFTYRGQGVWNNKIQVEEFFS